MTILHYIFRCKKENALLLFWLLVNTGCLLLHGIFSAQALTQLVALRIPAFLWNCLWVLLVNLVWMLQIRQVSIAEQTAIQAMNTAIREDLSHKIAKSSYQAFHKQDTATYTSWMTNDVQTIQDLGFETFELMTTQVMNVVGATVTLATYHPSFILTLLLFTLLMAGIPKLFSKQLEEATQAFSQKNEELVQHIQNSLSGFDVLLNAQKTNYIPSKIILASKDLADSRTRYGRAWGNLLASQNGTSFISQLSILTQAGILFAFKLVPVGIVAQAQYFASIVFTGLTGLFANYAELKNTHVLFEKFDQLKSEESFVPQETKNGDLQLEKISFSYANQKIFQELTLNIKNKQHSALIGASGKGKSTLLKILASYLPIDNGSFFINDRPVKTESLHHLVTYLPQEAYVFNETLQFNLTLGDSIANDKIQQTIQAFYLEEISQNYLNEPLKSETLSGGQKQRIALARAFLQDKPILLLDEATSAIDSVRARAIESFLFSQTEKTILFSTHHLNQETLNQLDSVINLDTIN